MEKRQHPKKKYWYFTQGEKEEASKRK